MGLGQLPVIACGEPRTAYAVGSILPPLRG